VNWLVVEVPEIDVRLPLEIDVGDFVSSASHTVEDETEDEVLELREEGEVKVGWGRAVSKVVEDDVPLVGEETVAC
jgi:hypothetical protein